MNKSLINKQGLLQPLKVAPKGTSYKAEAQRLRSLVDPEVWQLLEVCGAYVAGGAVTSVFHKQ